MANWQRITPEERRKLKGILGWMRTTRHPHGKCVRALMKKGVPQERANRICAVAKDAAMGSTGWRSGG
jgi:hypothetical protein